VATTALLAVLKSELADFPYVAGHVSALGGAGRESVLMAVSLQPKSEWKNGRLSLMNRKRLSTLAGTECDTRVMA
jgi:hypothetical protein